MTSDLAARLRAVTANSLICREAADELERLRTQVKALQTYPPMLFDPETGTITPLRTAVETNTGRDAETREGSVRQARDTPCDVTISTSETAGPQLCTCRDGARYRFIRQGEDELPTGHEAAFAAMWAEIALKGFWRECMDKRIDEAMQQLDGEGRKDA